MRVTLLAAVLVFCFATLQSSSAQDETDQPDRAAPKGKPPVDRIMTLDKNSDGVIDKSEADGERIKRMFDRVDANDDGKLTREEIEKAFAGRGRLQGQGPGRFGRPGDDRGRPGGMRGRPGGPPEPGTILPKFVQNLLGLSDEQKEQLDKLQAHVDAQLKEILTSEQQEKLAAGRGLHPPHGPGPRGGGAGPRGGGAGPRGGGGRPPRE